MGWEKFSQNEMKIVSSYVLAPHQICLYRRYLAPFSECHEVTVRIKYKYHTYFSEELFFQVRKIAKVICANLTHWHIGNIFITI